MNDTDAMSMARQKHQMLQIICLAILASLAIYSGIAWFLLQQGGEGFAAPESLPSFLPMALAAVALMTLVSGEAVAQLLKARAAKGATPEERVSGHFQAVIVAFALREAVGVFGLVLTLLTGNLMWVVGLSGLAAAAMAAGWPRLEQLEALAASGPRPIA